ncbi:hypothetical protein ACIOJ9_34855 [Streptomyces sp. NPDC088175]|uniref:hypothetical protein n=1 Tax=unclassified Streptomyces TaxID=2593676 RepID=UPI003829DE0D
MTALPYEVIQALSVPEQAYNADDIATIVVTGESYGGAWGLSAISTHLPPDEATAIGRIETAEAPRRPDLALETAQEWIRSSCTEAGLVLGHFKDLNGTFGPDEAPFFSSGQFLIDRRPA